MNKKGFTLVEIIVVISLIVIIGVGSTVVLINNEKKELDVLISNENNFENALEVYLSNNEEILNNVNNNVEGAVVSLELLKNEGLINDNLDIDYKNEYFLLSNAVLLSPGDDGASECDGRISISTIKSWDLSNYDSSKVIYICPNGTSGGDGGEQSKILRDVIINNAKKTLSDSDKGIYSEKTIYSPAPIKDFKTLSLTEDDNGFSYYFHGLVKDNYVNFANMCWRIVRIEGDGSIKLILASQKGACEKSSSLTDDSAFLRKNTTSSPYEVVYSGNEQADYFNGTNNSMYGKINEFSNKFTAADKSKLKNSVCCVDDRDSVETHMKEAGFRFFRQFKSLKNIGEIKNNIYVAPLTSDEITLSFDIDGLHQYNDNLYYNSFLLDNANGEWWSLSYYSYGSDGYAHPFILGGASDYSNNTRTYLQVKGGTGNAGVAHIRPTVSLKSGITISQGDGTQTNPYVIE